MKYHELQVKKNRGTRRLGRGISAGQGKTAGRGTKGQNSRKSGPPRPGFEGGQTPLINRLPKLRGIAKGSLSRSAKKPKAENIYTEQLNAFANKTADNFLLFEAGLLSSPYTRAKVLLKGNVTAKVEVRLQGASANAAAAIAKGGGSFVKTPMVLRVAAKPEKQK